MTQPDTRTSRDTPPPYKHSVQNQTLIEGIVLGMTNEQASTRAGVSRATLQRRLRQDGFKRRLDEALAEATKQVARRSTATARAALDILMNVAADREVEVTYVHKGQVHKVTCGASTAPGCANRIAAARALVAAHTALVARRAMAEDGSDRPGLDVTVVGVPDLAELLT